MDRAVAGRAREGEGEREEQISRGGWNGDGRQQCVPLALPCPGGSSGIGMDGVRLEAVRWESYGSDV